MPNCIQMHMTLQSTRIQLEGAGNYQYRDPKLPNFSAGNECSSTAMETHGTGLDQDLCTCTLVVPVHFEVPEGLEVSR